MLKYKGANQVRKLQPGLYQWLQGPRTYENAKESALNRITHAASRFPKAVVSHQSAALLHGLSSFRESYPVSITQEGQLRTRLVGVKRYSNALPPQQVTLLNGLRVTTLARTVVDCARELPAELSLALVDESLRRGLTRKVLLTLNSDLPSARNHAKARSVIELGDEGAESPMESRLRYILILAGFTGFVTQQRIDALNGKTYFGDLAIPSLRIIFEYDGRGKYTTVEDLLSEKEREDAIRLMGWRMVRIQAHELTNVEEAAVRMKRIVQYLTQND